MMIDTGRTHAPYGNAYYWTMFMTRLPDGRVVTINVHDGKGNYNRLDYASEDFVTIDNDFYKLDVNRMISADNKKFLGEKRFKTAEESEYYKRVVLGNDCDVTFNPVIADSDQSIIEDGVNVGLIAFKQYLIYGYFNGHCQLMGADGKSFRIDIERAYGHVEYVFNRW